MVIGEGRDEGQGLGEGSSLSLCQPLSLFGSSPVSITQPLCKDF